MVLIVQLNYGKCMNKSAIRQYNQIRCLKARLKEQELKLNSHTHLSLFSTNNNLSAITSIK